MNSHIKAIVAASAYAFITGKKVAGLFDHTTGRHLRIAAESRAEHLQGYDGDRDARFGGILPELGGGREAASLHMEIEGSTARGYDRSSSAHFSASVAGQLVQLYDHTEGVWFAFDVQVAPAA